MSPIKTSTTGANLQAALALAALRIPVFPVGQNKVPLLPGWQHRGTTDPTVIRRLWKRHPGAMPGIPTGPTSGIAVLDLDVKNGVDGFKTIRAKGIDPDTLSSVIVETPSGGRHLYFADQDGLRSTAGQIGPGVDTRAAGGFVVGPGSVNGKGVYRFLGAPLGGRLPEWPKALTPALTRPLDTQPARPTGLPWHVMESAIAAVPNDEVGYDEWLHMGMAIHAETGGSEEGLVAWLEWSEQSGKHDHDKCMQDWRRFKADRPGGITGWHIIREAQRRGWDDPAVKLEEAQQDFDQLERLSRPDDGEGRPFTEEQKAWMRKFIGGPGWEETAFPYLTPEQCGGLPYPPYIVKGLIEEGNVGTIVGAPGAAKTVLALHLTYMVALGRSFLGMRTNAGRVLYIASENLRGMHRRLEAVARELGPTADFRLLNATPDLSSKSDLARLRRDVEAWRPSLIVVDTLTSAWPGLEENTSEAMSAVYAMAKSLTACGAAVVILHHPNHNGDPRPRGHGALYGPLDFNLFLARDGREVRGIFTKNKQGSTERTIAFAVREVKLRNDPDGEPVTAPILEESDSSHERLAKLTPSATAALAILLGLGGSAEEAEFRKAVVDSRTVCGSENPESRKKAFKRAVEELTRNGRVCFHDQIYSAHRPDDEFPDFGDDRSQSQPSRSRTPA